MIPGLLLIAKLIGVLIVLILLLHVIKVALTELAFPESVKQLILIAVALFGFVFLVKYFNIYMNF